MKKWFHLLLISCGFILLLTGCHPAGNTSQQNSSDSLMQAKLSEYVRVRLTTDLSLLTPAEKQMIPLLIEASRIMDELFWQQTFPGDKASFLQSLTYPDSRAFAEINYGPWERLNGDRPFLPGFGEKPSGANFYPVNMEKTAFEQWADPDKTSLYTVIRFNPDSSLRSVWYHEEYRENLEKAAGLLKQAATLAEDPGLKKYLELRAEALVTDIYYPSDIAWMDMKDNTVDIVIGPIENYEDQLFGYKTAYEAAVLVKDKEWSRKLEKFTAFLPLLQSELPVEARYKQEKPGGGSDLNAYDIIYCAGDMNCGSKTIAINLPNDEKVQMKKGSRRLQLKNAMQAKFMHILLPIAGILIDSSQRAHITFDAFFSNIMFHEVAHGLGIRNTVTGKGTVRGALKEKYSAFEEAKADILGLFMIVKLIGMGEITGITPEDCYVTYLAGMFRSVRFGASSSHGKANMMCFNFFSDKGAFERRPDGTYRVNMEKTREAVNEWASKVLVFEGDGDYPGASAYLEANGAIGPGLQAELELLRTRNIPVDIVYDQGVTVLGLTE
jgi:hypothetical protein